ncbi:XdhC family protein [Pseudoroseicyclus tamaricis]|uniref:XdhC family protein n=1 Tax=Pseudoroseicyclus tamaricis TaxID=2705421 RepID=A0A6B2JVL5_9RHOB|nr:XdhC family protein [Pseudoroseicyclus tamaricis]NDV00679.1 XdhC family protein [Pseudoroseicyclus tamaricis]
MQMPALNETSVIGPVLALLRADSPGTLALITGTEGPSYRPVGAMMAVLEGRQRAGSLSSGCVEADIALHAEAALAEGTPAHVRYGRGSKFKDIQLPCGGGLDVLMVPAPDRDVLGALAEAYEARRPVTLCIDTAGGGLSLSEDGQTGWQGETFCIRIEPEIFFYVFGKGPETSTFAALVQSAGYPNLILSSDDETLAAAEAAGCPTRHLTGASVPEDVAPDDRSAIVLFFHDHDWEPPILKAALNTPAFYIGAQGSQRARHLRDYDLQALGVGEDALARLKGPIGLVRSARDARTLAVSVLAEVLAEA